MTLIKEQLKSVLLIMSILRVAMYVGGKRGLKGVMGLATYTETRH